MREGEREIEKWERKKKYGERGRMREMINREKVRENGEKKLEIMETERES